MKVVFRADDVGYSDISNIGAFKSIDEGVVSLVELMPDTPGAVNAMEFLRDRPWVSVNWHSHFWGSPVLPAEQVPSLVDTDGRFKHNWKSPHWPVTDGWDLDELVQECRAEIDRWIRIMGKAPDATQISNPEQNIIDKAKKIVCDEYGIVYGYDRYWHIGPAIRGHEPGPNDSPSFNRKYEDRKIYEYENFGLPGMRLSDYRAYDPLKMIKTMPESDCIWVRSQHPNYVCDLVWEDTWNNCSITRCKDVEVLCSQELQDWIVEQHVEVINLRDAIYGTNEYQNHLKAIGSPIAMR